MDFKIIKYLIIFLLLQFNSQAIEFEGKFIQGHFILGKTEPGAKIQIDKKSVRVSKDGFFAFGLGRDRKNDVIITETLNGIKNQFVKKVLKREYKIQRIDGLPEKKVTPPKEVYDRIRKENKLIGNARAIDADLILSNASGQNFSSHLYGIDTSPITFLFFQT